MNPEFEKSEIYKKALDEYNKKVFGAMLKPMHSFVVDEDEVYLVYCQELTNDVLTQMKEIYRKTEEADDYLPPVYLGYQVPEILEITLLNQKCKAIHLWYDHSEVPMEFQAKI